MPFASLQPSVIDDYLYTELAKGRVAVPFSSPPKPHHHISFFSVIPEKHQPGKWRLILDLASSDGHSVNDGIRKRPFHGPIYESGWHYWQDHVAWSGHFTCEVWCRKCPPHYYCTPQWSLPSWHAVARQLLCGHGLTFWFAFSALHFFFSCGPGGMGPQKKYDVSFFLHYLDDFHTLGPPNSQTCQQNLHTCIQQFQDWGIPLHPD